MMTKQVKLERHKGADVFKYYENGKLVAIKQIRGEKAEKETSSLE